MNESKIIRNLTDDLLYVLQVYLGWFLESYFLHLDSTVILLFRLEQTLELSRFVIETHVFEVSLRLFTDSNTGPFRDENFLLVLFDDFVSQHRGSTLIIHLIIKHKTQCTFFSNNVLILPRNDFFVQSPFFHTPSSNLLSNFNFIKLYFSSLNRSVDRLLN